MHDAMIVNNIVWKLSFVYDIYWFHVHSTGNKTDLIIGLEELFIWSNNIFIKFNHFEILSTSNCETLITLYIIK